MFRRIVAINLVISTIWISTWSAAPGWAQDSPPSELTYEEAIERVERFMNHIEALRSHLDRSQFDLDVLLAELDFDAEKIVAFVKKEVVFEAYLGALRGAQGTLMSRAGNALDQSVLLATILKDAGYEARIAYGNLNYEQARTLLGQLQNQPTYPKPFRDPAAADELLDEMQRMSGQKIDTIPSLSLADQESFSMLSAEFREATSTAAKIEQVLKDAELIGEVPDLRSQLLSESQDYYWVEFKDDSSGTWEPVHPAISIDWSLDLDPRGYWVETIPAEFQHRLKIETFATIRAGGKTTKHSLMDPWERPTANLTGLPIVIQNLPEGLLLKDNIDDPSSAIESSQYFLPLLNGSPPEGAKAFSLGGNLVAVDVFLSDKSGLFRTFNEKTSNATSAILSLGSKADSDQQEMTELEVVENQYTLIRPGYDNKVITRTVYDSSERVRNREPQGSLAVENTLMLGMGTLSDAYIFDRNLETLLSIKPVVEELLRMELLEPAPSEISELLTQIRQPWIGHLLTFSLFDMPFSTDPDIRVYRHEPQMLIHEQLLGSLPDISTISLDIANNSRRAVQVAKGEVQPRPDILMRAGIWETYIERELFGGTEEVDSTISVFARAEQSGASIVAVSSENGEVLDGLGLKPSTLRYIQQDLDAGFVVVIPQTVASHERVETGWWRVNPNSGETLGMLATGRGQSATTYIILLSGIAVGLIAGTTAFLGCGGAKDIKAGKYIAAGVCGICGVFAYAVAALTHVVFFMATIPEVAGAAALSTSLPNLSKYKSLMQALSGLMATYMGFCVGAKKAIAG